MINLFNLMDLILIIKPRISVLLFDVEDSKNCWRDLFLANDEKYNRR